MQNERKICPTCGARRQMEHFNDRIVDFLRQNHITRRDSCILCVEKHIGYAKALYRELLTLNRDVKGSIELNHLEIIGELRAATEEAQEYAELFAFLLDTERQYRYEGLEPDWNAIANHILKIKEQETK